MSIPHSTTKITGEGYITFVLDKNFDVYFSVDAIVVWGFLGCLITYLLYRVLTRHFGFGSWKSFEVNQTEFGLGGQKITLRPNNTDRQIAYKVWVELSTRKIGLPINLDDDVIAEIYDSWYAFFAVTRELIKDVPVTKFRRKDTEKIIRLCIEVLNNGIRPNLTRWQARFRRWYESALNNDKYNHLPPQEIQKIFPDYTELATEIEEVNQRLIKYRDKMYELVTRL